MKQIIIIAAILYFFLKKKTPETFQKKSASVLPEDGLNDSVQTIEIDQELYEREYDKDFNLTGTIKPLTDINVKKKKEKELRFPEEAFLLQSDNYELHIK